MHNMHQYNMQYHTKHYSCRGFEANPLYIELWIYYRCKRNLILTSLALWIFKIGQTVQKLAKCIPGIFRTIFLSVHVTLMSEFLRIFLHTNFLNMKLLILRIADQLFPILVFVRGPHWPAMGPLWYFQTLY